MPADERSDRTGATCPDCFAVVEDLDAHERWHTRLISDIAKAVEQELRRRASA